MQLSELHPAKNSTKKIKRVGRGHGCHVKTACRGSNGQKSRSGGTKGPGFEGGQTPWYRRLPKYKGFKNIRKIEYSVINLDTLEKLTKYDEITPEILLTEGVVKSLRNPIKVLGDNEISRAVKVRMHKFSKSAEEAITKAGGKIEVI